MKKLFTIFLLLGMSPGTLLPSSITDQLIAPALPQSEKTQDADTKNTGDIPDTEKESSPSKKQVAAGVPSIYSAIRPGGFHFTKGDIRTILTPKRWVTTFSGSLSDAFRAQKVNSRPESIMELDFCNSHRAAVTSPEICAHAPPVRS